MRAGLKSERITLETKQVTRDAVGGEGVTWTTFFTTWAQAEPLSGRELVSVRAVYADVTTRFQFDYLEGVHPALRVTWRGGAYDILEVIPVRKRRELQILCRGPAGAA